MDPRTQRLAALLARPVTALVLSRLHQGPASEAELRRAARASQPTVNRCLNELGAHKLVERAEPVDTGKRGRPTRPWRITSQRRLAEVERALDLLGR